MFTGLIEEVGIIVQVIDSDPQRPEAGKTLTLKANLVLENLKLGDSIALDGTCTTVIAFDSESFTVELSPETLEKTISGHYVPGSRVNLERPLMPSSRIGGHFVTGHVDGLAKVVTRTKHGNSWVYRFQVQQAELMPYIVEKGSITVQGISLTVNTMIQNVFSVAIIPHTLKQTNLDDYGVEDWVNIETDLLGKYAHQLFTAGHLPQQVVRQELSGLTVEAVIPGINQSVNPQIHTGEWFCHDENLRV